MSPWGTGTRDSPIVLDEDSEGEFVTGAYDPIHRTPSPRPRTFLSAMQVPRLSEASARSLQQFKEGLQQQVLTGKRKREPDSDLINDLKLGDHMAKDPNPLHNQAQVGLSPTDQQSKRQRNLSLKLEREAKVEGAGQGKGTQEATPSLSLPATENHHDHQIFHTQVPSSMPTPSPGARQRKRTKHTPKSPSVSTAPAAPNPKSNPSVPIQISSSTLPATAPVTTKPLLPPKPMFGILPTLANETTRPGPQFGFSGFPGVSLGSFGAVLPMRSPEVPFNTLHPSPFPSFSVFGRPPPVPSPPPPPPLPLPPATTTPIIRQHTNSLPLQKMKLPFPKKLQNPEKPFTLRPTSSNSTTLTPIYIPIGKPDFRHAHGIFPILPTVPVVPSKPSNHPSTSAAAASIDPHNKPNSYYDYTPILGNTLVMENIPANLCDEKWISNWSRSACGVAPLRIIIGPRSALIEYPSSEVAIAAWASPKLGVDEFGRNKSSENNNNNRPKDFTITLYWWRLDKGGEKKLLRMWRVWKKQVSVEMRKAITHRLRQLEAESNVDVELAELNGATGGGGGGGEEFEVGTTTPIASGTSGVIQSVQQAKDELIAVAGRLDFEGRLEDLMKAGVPEDEICRWEQRVVARIERSLRAVKCYHTFAEDIFKREDDESLTRTAFNAPKKAEVGEKRKRRRGNKSEKKRLSEGERKTMSTDYFPRSRDPSYPPVTAEPSEKSEGALTRFPAPSTPSSAFASTSTSTAFSSPPNTPYPSPFSLTFSANSNTSYASNSNNGSSQLLFGLDQTRGLGGFGPSLRPPFAPTPTPATAFASSSTSASVLTSSSALGTKILLSEKTSISLIPQISPLAASPHQLGTTPPAATSFPRRKTPPTLSPLPNPLKRKFTEPEPAIMDQDPAVKKLREIGPVTESRTQAQPLAVLNVSEISTCLDTAPNLPAAAATTAPAAEATVASSSDSITPRGIAEGKLVEGLRKLGQEMVSRTSSSFLRSPTSPSVPDTPGALTSTMLAPVETKITQSSTLKTGQETLETARGPGAPSPTASGRPSVSGTSVSAVVPPRLSPDDMDTSSASEQDKPTKLVANTATKNQIISQQRNTRQQTSTLIARPTISPAVLEALKTIMTKTIGERQQFLDTEFKMTKALMANLETAHKDRKKGIMKIWNEKIRIINEVTKSIKNDNRVWYSHEVRTWIRMQWPSGQDDIGVLVVSDDEG